MMGHWGWLTSPWVEYLGWTLLHFVWQGALVGVALAIALILLRRHAAAARYMACLGAVFLMMIFPLITLTCNVIDVDFAAFVREEGDHGADTSGGMAVGTSNAQENLVFPEGAVLPTAPSEAVTFFNWIPWIVVGWMVGVFTLSLRLLGGWVHIEMLRRKMCTPVEEALRNTVRQLQQRLGIKYEVTVLRSELAETPMTLGFIQPIILLPASVITGLHPDQLEGVLAHELAHICRNDFLYNLFLTLLETLFFYHPMVWWLSRRMRAEREFCCDDLAVAVVGDRVDYARALANLESLRHVSPPDLAAAAVGQGELFTRIRRLISPPKPLPHSSAWLWGGFSTMILVALCMTTLHMTSVSALGFKPELLETPTFSEAMIENVNVTPASTTTHPTLEPGGVALLDFERVGATDTLRDAVGQLHALVTTALAESPNIRIVDREKLKDALTEVRLGSTGLADPTTAARLGQIVGARTLVDGKLMLIDEEWVFTARLIDAETTETRGLRVTGKVEDGLLDLGDAVATVMVWRIEEVGNARTQNNESNSDSLRIAATQKELAGRELPRIAVRIPEANIGTMVPDSAGENEFIRTLRELGFTVVDVDTLVEREQNIWWMELFFGPDGDGEGHRGGLRQGWQDPAVIMHNQHLVRLREKADLFIIGEAFSELVSEQYGFQSYQARMEVKVLNTKTDEVAAADSQHATAADLGELVASKKALREAGGILALKMAVELADFWTKQQEIGESQP